MYQRVEETHGEAKPRWLRMGLRTLLKRVSILCLCLSLVAWPIQWRMQKQRIAETLRSHGFNVFSREELVRVNKFVFRNAEGVFVQEIPSAKIEDNSFLPSYELGILGESVDSTDEELFRLLDRLPELEKIWVFGKETARVEALRKRYPDLIITLPKRTSQQKDGF